ncbi:MAG: hypothetical protein A3J79_04155 [Elusimicrobia bacterium RIFOXYB2_FULL_62_6]|nr:MAG: hypothetical protein A3J79_04155 [Elusimicrobia bacterium RIFOXYB2_FULL_62_6]
MPTKNKYIVPVILSVCGFGVWFLISSAFHLREAWDGPGGKPFFISMLLLNAVAGFIEPERKILKGLASVFLQPLAIFIKSGEVGSLFPIGLIAFFVLGLLFSIAAALGAFVKNKFFTPAPNK